MLQITKRELIELGACKDGLKRFIRQTNGTDFPVNVVSLIGGENSISDLLWLAGKKLSRDKIIRFACDCALINIDLIQPYTNNFNLIVDYLKNPQVESVDVVYDTDDICATAYAAAAAAHDATYAPYAAAYDIKEKVNELLVKLFSN